MEQMFSVQQVRNSRNSNHGHGVRVIDSITVPASEVEAARWTMKQMIHEGGPKASGDWVRAVAV